MELFYQEQPIFQLLASSVFTSCLGLSFGGTILIALMEAPGWTGT